MAITDVTILVERNANAPEFSQLSYALTVTDQALLGETLLAITATDDDGDLLKYSLTGSGVANEFFYINPTTGDISLKKLLTEGTDSTYTVS